MPKIIEAVYENGVFKPLQKVNLKEGEKVRLVVRENVDNLRGKYGRRKVDMMKLRDEVHDRRDHFSR
ncbi:antitoxin family protein [Archaeoglobus sp.]